MTSPMGYLEYSVLPVEPALMPGDMPKVLEYWNAVRGGRFAPPWSDFKLHDLPPPAIPMTVVVDVTGDDPATARYVYRFWGTRRAELYRRENTGLEVREALPDKSGPIIAEQLGLVLQARTPLLFRNLYPFKPAEVATCITLRLPIATPDGRAVGKIATTAIIVDNPEAYADFVAPPDAASSSGG